MRQNKRAADGTYLRYFPFTALMLRAADCGLSRSKHFSVRRVADTTLGKFRDDGLYLSVLPIGEIIC